MKIRIRFVKQGNLRFLGHLDIMRYFQKVMRRAGIPIRYTEGYSPHQIMSFAAPLSVGVMSRSEYMDIEADFTGTGEELIGRLNAAGVPELKVLSAGVLGEHAKNAMSVTAAAAWTTWVKPEYASFLAEEDRALREMLENPASLFAETVSFCGQPQIPCTKKTRRGEKAMDLAPLIYEAKVVTDGFGDQPVPSYPRLYLHTSSGNNENVKPDQVLDTFFKSRGLSYPAICFQTEREELYADEDPENHRFVPLCGYALPIRGDIPDEDGAPAASSDR